jgi:dipeptidyl aminopeptidase/acylaminoacyl peptidase
MVIGALVVAAALAASAPLDAKASVEVADISSLKLSPDQRWLAFRVDQPDVDANRVRLAWFVVPTDGNARPRRVADGGEALFDGAGLLLEEAPLWSPDSSAIYFRRSDGSSVQIWRASVHGSSGEQVTRDPGNVAHVALENGGRTLVYLAGAGPREIAAAEQSAREEGVLMDGRIELAAGAVGGLRDNDRERSVRLSEGWFERGGILDDEPPREVVLSLGTKTTLSERQLDAWPATASPQRRDVDRRCADDGCRGVLKAWAITLSDGSTLVAEIDVTGETAVRQASAGGKALPSLRSTGQLAGSRNSWMPCVGGAALYCVEAAALDPPRLVALDRRTGSARTLYDANPGLRTALRGIVHRSLTWRSADGEVFGGHLIGGGTRRPVVVQYYDCHGFLRGGLGDELPIVPLAERGIATLCINASYLPSSSGDGFTRYERGLASIRTILQSLGEEGEIDRERVGMHGLSFGSEVTMWVVRHSDLLRAASIASPQGDPGYFWLNAASRAGFAERFSTGWQIGDPDRDPEGWRRFSPARDTASVRTPLLMQFAELEARQSAELYAKLRDSHVPIEMYVYPGASHLKSQPKQKLRVYERNLDWFRFWLAGMADPAPAKHAQYGRWSAMRARFEAADGSRPLLGVHQVQQGKIVRSSSGRGAEGGIETPSVNHAICDQ